ncbi:glutamate--tRNA ligase [Candidatus Berkelbacteria bacterium]|nr:glutamate--tRNA ligase [Candidatus Berkelbacteria bacterium]
MTDSTPVRVRFAPSPTGELHLGGARTALYEYLFAKHHGGQVFLRIEDTDQKRFVSGSMDRFIDDLAWLGIAFDGEPIIQSGNAERHREIAHELVKRGAAYYEPTTDETHGGKRTDDEYRAGRTAYRGQDRDLTTQPDGPFVIRLKVPDGTIALNDVVRGRVEFDLATVDDAVLFKSDGMGTYHLAAMVDDHDMGITHIMRTEEWLPSSPKHLLIFQAMGWEVPQFAHLPLILALDGKKLSKRIHGEAVWVSTYRKQGYLPQALTNYLALLGWNPGGDRELMTHDELIEAFSLDRVHKAGAKFDQAKLDAFQAHYVQALPIDELTKQLEPFANGLVGDELRKLATIVQGRLGKLSDFASLTHYFCELPVYDPALLVFKKSSPATTKLGLQAAVEQLERAGEETWQSEETLAQLLERVVEVSGLTNGDVFWPVRVALTGQERSPSPAECLWVLGKEESLKRLGQALEHLK